MIYNSLICMLRGKTTCNIKYYFSIKLMKDTGGILRKIRDQSWKWQGTVLFHNVDTSTSSPLQLRYTRNKYNHFCCISTAKEAKGARIHFTRMLKSHHASQNHWQALLDTQAIQSIGRNYLSYLQNLILTHNIVLPSFLTHLGEQSGNKWKSLHLTSHSSVAWECLPRKLN